MTERIDRGLGEPVDRGAIMGRYISPQIDRLIGLGFHKSAASSAYMEAIDVATGYTSAVEARFRTQMHDQIVLPEHIENPSTLILIVPTARIDRQARALGMDSFMWHPHLDSDSDLPQVPYAIEVVRGNENQSPKHFAFHSNGVIDTLNSMSIGDSENGSLDAIGSGLRNVGLRGLNTYELLACAREAPNDFQQLHGLMRRLLLPETDISFYPSLARDGDSLFCLRSGRLEVPTSMAEVPFTRSDTRFVGASNS